MILSYLCVCVMSAHAIDLLKNIRILLQNVAVLCIQMWVVCAFNIDKVSNTLLIIVRLLCQDRVPSATAVFPSSILGLLKVVRV